MSFNVFTEPSSLGAFTSELSSVCSFKLLLVLFFSELTEQAVADLSSPIFLRLSFLGLPRFLGVVSVQLSVLVASVSSKIVGKLHFA
jgi:hypothetical protein